LQTSRNLYEAKVSNVSDPRKDSASGAGKAGRGVLWRFQQYFKESERDEHTLHCAGLESQSCRKTKLVRASRLISIFIGVIRRPEKREEGATLRMRVAHLLAVLGGIFGCFVVKGSS
jgi:hypothetical protein